MLLYCIVQKLQQFLGENRTEPALTVHTVPNSNIKRNDRLLSLVQSICLSLALINGGPLPVGIRRFHSSAALQSILASCLRGNSESGCERFCLCDLGCSVWERLVSTHAYKPNKLTRMNRHAPFTRPLSTCDTFKHAFTTYRMTWEEMLMVSYFSINLFRNYSSNL